MTTFAPSVGTTMFDFGCDRYHLSKSARSDAVIARGACAAGAAWGAAGAGEDDAAGDAAGAAAVSGDASRGKNATSDPDPASHSSASVAAVGLRNSPRKSRSK